MTGVAPHPVLKEEYEWEHAVKAFLGPDAELISVSRWIGDSRVYVRRDRLALIRSLATANPPPVNSLHFEAEILKRLGWEAECISEDEWEALRVSRIEGAPLERRMADLSLRERALLLAQLIPQLRALHRKEVAHRDLRADNVLIEPSGRPRIIDFDRAIVGTGWTPALADWIGISSSGLSPNPYWKLALFTLIPKVQSGGRRFRARLKHMKAFEKRPLAADLKLLESAWEIAERSAANAPGQALAYYALTYKHWHFPGERPWYLRWDAIRRRVPLEGKRVLDLGSNMGLLPTFALLHGAESAVGVDADADVLRAAAMIAQAFGVSPKFRQLDLNEAPNWEEELSGSDIVVAMSLLEWLDDDRRLLNFLGCHREVIYEGHDPVEFELARVKSAGFMKREILTETERGRFLVYGRKN
jgi:hypothetical protein